RCVEAGHRYWSVRGRAPAREEPELRGDWQEGRREAGRWWRTFEARHRRLLHGARALHRDDERHAAESRGSLRPRGCSHPREGLRRGAGGGERHAVRSVVGHRDDVTEAGEPFQAQLDERPRDGESADGRPRLPRAVRRPEEEQLRPSRAGQLREGFLHDLEDRVHGAIGRRSRSFSSFPFVRVVASRTNREGSMRQRWLMSVVMLLATIALVHAEDWPQWRGPLGNGIAADANLPLKWSAKENVAWT